MNDLLFSYIFVYVYYVYLFYMQWLLLNVQYRSCYDQQLLTNDVIGKSLLELMLLFSFVSIWKGGSVAEWLACWTQGQ